MTYNGRGLRLAAARRPLPAARRGARPRRPPGPPAARPPPVPAPAGRRAAADRGAEILGRRAARRRRRLGDPGATSASSAAGRPQPLRAVVRHNDRTFCPSPACSRCCATGCRRRRRGSTLRPATSGPSPGRSPGPASKRHSPASRGPRGADAPARRPSRCHRPSRRGLWLGLSPPRGRTSRGGRRLRPGGLRRAATAARSGGLRAGTGRAAFAATWDAQRIAARPRAPASAARPVSPRRPRPGPGSRQGPARTAIVGWIELAKLREHRLGDPAGALYATASRGSPRPTGPAPAGDGRSRGWRRTSPIDSGACSDGSRPVQRRGAPRDGRSAASPERHARVHGLPPPTPRVPRRCAGSSQTRQARSAGPAITLR